VLVDEGLVDRDLVIRALQEQQARPRLLSDILLDNDGVTPYDLARAIVENYQVPFLDVSGYAFHKELLAMFPGELLHEMAVIPMDRFGRQMCFVCQEIPGGAQVDRLKEFAEGGLYFYVGLSHDIRECLHNQVPFEGAAGAGGEDADDEVVAPLIGDEPLPESLEVLTEDEKAAAALEVLRQDSDDEDEDAAASDSVTWKQLFDSADASILSELGTGSDE